MRLPHRAALASALLAVVLVAACAARSGGGAAAPAAVSAIGYGTVVVVRPVLLAASGLDGHDVRASILGAIGDGGMIAVRGGAVRPAEIIVHADDGATLSVVQAGAALRPGERVAIEPGAETTLAPAAGS